MDNEIRKGNEFQDKILAFVRISKSQYNNDVASGRLYMNKQSRFIEKENLTTGQADNKESLVVEGETDFVLKFGVLNKQYSLPITKMRHNLDVYIFCAYEIRLSEISYDKNNDCYVHVIPWEYISSFVDDTGEAEMLIISTPEIFVKKFYDAASKAGLIALAKSIGQEMGPKGIRANAIAPGFIETAMTAALPDEVREQWKQKIPLRRGGQVEDIANVATFLASDMSSYVSGQVIQVDGGMNM